MQQSGSLTIGGIPEGVVQGESSVHSLTQTQPLPSMGSSKIWTLGLQFVFFGDYYQAAEDEHYTVIDSTYEFIMIDWPIFTNF